MITRSPLLDIASDIESDTELYAYVVVNQVVIQIMRRMAQMCLDLSGLL